MKLNSNITHFDRHSFDQLSLWMTKYTLDQIDLFTGTPDTTVSTPAADLKSATEIKPTVCPPRTIYSVERLTNGYTRITQHGRVTFNGLMGRVTA